MGGGELKMSKMGDSKCHVEKIFSGGSLFAHFGKLLFLSAGARRAPAANEKIASRGKFSSFSRRQRARKVTILGPEWYNFKISTHFGTI